MKAQTSNGFVTNPVEVEKKNINSELWHACAGPLVSLPLVGSLVVYFPQGHSEQVAASMHKELDSIPNYPLLPSKLICRLHSVTLHADSETDEVYAKMTLQPVNKYDREAMMASEMGLKQNKQPTEFFCKTLTASDTSTHGGFSVPRRAAEKIFPPLDYTMQPPAQELVAKDLHDISWKFRHIYRGQPKRHLLTTGWSVFVSTKRLLAGDSVLFIRDEKLQLLLGIRRANRQQPALSSSVLSSDSMHIGILAAAAHAAANNSSFTIFYNPRASTSEFVIPLAKYNKALYTQVSLGMRFRMLFETEDSGVRRYMGTITGISDLDPVRWKNSHWRNLQVGWDESTATDRRSRVSIWEIEPVVTPFYICPPPFFRPKFSKQPGMPDDESEVESAFRRAMPWLSDDFALKDVQSAIFPGMSLVQWMAMQQNSQLVPSATQSTYLSSMPTIGTQDGLGTSNEDKATRINFQAQTVSLPNFHSGGKANPQVAPLNQLHQQPQALSRQQTEEPQQNSMSLHQQAPPPPPPQQQQQIQLQQSRHQQLRPVAHYETVNQQNARQLQSSSGKLMPQAQLVNHIVQAPSQPQVPQQQGLTREDNHLQGGPSLPILPSIQQPSQIIQTQQSVDYQHNLLQNQAQQCQQLSQPEVQLQLLQKLQQQQVLSQLSQQYQSQIIQQMSQKSQEFHQQNLQSQLSNCDFVQTQLKQQQQASASHTTDPLKAQLFIRAQPTIAENDVPSCSAASPNNPNVSSMNSPSAARQASVILTEATFTPPMENLLHEIQGKPDARIKQDMQNRKASIQLPNRHPVADQLDASSATSFCIDGSPQEGFALPPICFDGHAQVDQRAKLLNAAHVDGIIPDNLITRGMGSGKDIQNLLSAQKNPTDLETELSTAALSSQSFGIPDMSFKPGCSSDGAFTDNGIPNHPLWNNQTQRMRTYTKVQKRGSVGRSIDITRYRGYDELRHDLACMFGIQGQLEDPYQTDWKLVYIDHENDILLVGDDPWEEFVSCVKSIKILSPAEVQKMSLDGDLGIIPAQHQAYSGSEDANAWQGSL